LSGDPAELTSCIVNDYCDARHARGIHAYRAAAEQLRGDRQRNATTIKGTRQQSNSQNTMRATKTRPAEGRHYWISGFACDGCIRFSTHGTGSLIIEARRREEGP